MEQWFQYTGKRFACCKLVHSTHFVKQLTDSPALLRYHGWRMGNHERTDAVMAMLVVLYSHMGCPGGEAAQRHMEEQGIPYRMRDVLKDLEARAEFQRLGGIGTPMLQVGSHVLHGFDPDEFEAIRSQAERRPAHG